MEAVQGIYDGKTVRLLEPVKAHPNVRVIITFMESDDDTSVPRTRIEDVAGSLRYDGPAKTLAEMEDAIRKGVAERRK